MPLTAIDIILKVASKATFSLIRIDIFDLLEERDEL